MLLNKNSLPYRETTLSLWDVCKAQNTGATVYVIGDKIKDVYVYGEASPNYFKILREVESSGGATNVYDNIRALTGHAPDWAIDSAYNIKTTITRYIDNETNKVQYETRSFSNHKITDSDYYFGARHRKIPYLNLEFPDIVVFSDYNKGACSNYFPSKIPIPGFELAIVDSRYGTLDQRWLDHCQYAVLHATGEEISRNNLDAYDIVFHTNGPDPVRILFPEQSKTEPVFTIEVPPGRIIANAIGAGDTFTATLASWYAHVDFNHEVSDLKILTNWAIENCLQVIGDPYTSEPGFKYSFMEYIDKRYLRD